MFCKVSILYHNDYANVNRQIFNCCENTSFVKCDYSGCFRSKIRSAA